MNPTQNKADSGPWAVTAESLERRFGPVTALDGVSLQIRSGEFFSLLGPSGCGKTTLLRLVAGLDFPDAGRLLIGGRDAAGWPAHQRPVNTVFQSYALFPHLNVRENVGFGLRMKKVAGAELTTRVERALEMVQIGDLARRSPAELSGGQKQRVALARAVVNEPSVLLLDEPLGALDLKLRRQLQGELHQLQRRLGITFIYVTHDQDEALTMSDRIAVMAAGRIVQLDTPVELYERPRTWFVAEFLGSCNLVTGKILETTATSARVATEQGTIVIGSGTSRSVGEKITVAIRPEKTGLRRTASAEENVFPVTVENIVYAGAETTVSLRAGTQRWKHIHANASASATLPAVGEKVFLHLPAASLRLLDD